MLIYEALGDIEMARQLGERGLTRRIKEIRDGEYTEYPQLLIECVDIIQLHAEFQAQRLWMLGRGEESLLCIRDTLELANLHNVPGNEGLIELRDDLLTRISDPSV